MRSIAVGPGNIVIASSPALEPAVMVVLRARGIKALPIQNIGNIRYSGVDKEPVPNKEQ